MPNGYKEALAHAGVAAGAAFFGVLATAGFSTPALEAGAIAAGVAFFGSAGLGAWIRAPSAPPSNPQ